MSLDASRTAAALPLAQSAALAQTLADSTDITVFINGTVHHLESESQAAVLDLLQRLSRGEAVTVSSVADLLTTSQAAELAGISHTFVRNLTDRGEIPVLYKGTHRRISRDDVLRWINAQRVTR